MAGLGGQVKRADGDFKDYLRGCMRVMECDRKNCFDFAERYLPERGNMSSRKGKNIIQEGGLYRNTLINNSITELLYRYD
jgi:hypothetical protein